jgi:methionyl-tRNA formyltransferase
VRVLLVGDAGGIAQALRVLPPGALVGLVAASNRPQYHQELGRIASEHGVPLVVQPPWGSPEYASFVSAVHALDPQLILCNSYSMLLREDLLALAPAVNVHGGKVPQYRGPNPVQWQIIEDERNAGVTLHHITAEVDAGDVVAERTVPIGFDDTWRAVADRVVAAGDELLREELPAVLAGTAVRRPQDHASARTWPRRTPEDSRIDWNATVLGIHNLVRALGQGIPPAFYEHDGERVLLDRYLTPAEVTALVYAPGPGGRRLTDGDVELVPEAGELVRFGVVRGGRRIGACGLDEFDADQRTARTWAQPADAQAVELVNRFAREQLGLSLNLETP